MKNIMLEYYTKNSISPEHQKIEDIEVHYAKRKKLYRQCGIPEIAFRDAEILEVGPASGYNTLAFFHWNCKHVDLVEPNPQGIRDMKVLFAEQNIAENRYDMFEGLIEEYSTNRKYDIIIAEGFMSFIDNKEEVFNIFKELLNEKGIVVITCTEKAAYFVEIIKKLIGIALSKDIPEYEEKVEYLTSIFKPQLEKLGGGTSKLPEDWVKDVILNPVISSGIELSLAQAIQYLEEDFEVLGSSPSMFTDYSWNKDIWYDYKKDYLEQFDTKRLSLLLANMPELILSADQTKALVKYFEDIFNAETEYEKTLESSKIGDILNIMDSMEGLLQQNLYQEFMDVFYEIKDVLARIQKGESVNMENYPHFFAAFGRTQQYISFVKK